MLSSIFSIFISKVDSALFTSPSIGGGSSVKWHLIGRPKQMSLLLANEGQAHSVAGGRKQKTENPLDVNQPTELLESINV